MIIFVLFQLIKVQISDRRKLKVAKGKRAEVTTTTEFSTLQQTLYSKNDTEAVDSVSESPRL